MDDDGAGIDEVCWLETGLPHKDGPFAEFVGPDASTCVGEGFGESFSLLVAGFVRENRLSGALVGRSVLVMTSEVTGGFVVAKVLRSSLLGC